MEQIIKIDVPEGKVAKYDEETQTIKFVDKKPIRSKSWEEFCNNHPSVNNEYYFCNDSSIRSTSNRKYDKTPKRYVNKLFLSSREDAEGILALIQLTRLHDEWIGDWKPDFHCKNTCQYSIVYIGDIIHIPRNEYRNRLLTFPNYDLANQFKECFNDLITKAKRFI